MGWNRSFYSSSLYLLPRYEYEYSRFLFSFSRLVQAISDKCLYVVTPGNTWLLGVVCPDNDLADDSSND